MPFGSVFRLVEISCTVWVSLCLVGCGDGDTGRVAMRGQVTLAGSPISVGSISLLPAAGNSGPAANAQIKDGGYEFDRLNGPSAGAYRIVIMHTPDETPTSKADHFKSPPPAVRREWTSTVEIPDSSDFEHHIELNR